MAEYRVGLIGCGGIANAHAKVIQGLEQTRFVALCDVAGERAQDFNSRYADDAATVYTDYSEMFEREKLDIVYICLPPFAHRDEVEQAAQRGVHVFIEKPIALDMQLAERMVQAVESGGVQSQVGFMMRFGEAVEQAKALIDNGEAGAPGWALGVYRCNALHAPWWRDKSKSGGQIVEQIIHTYDIIRYLLGEPKSAYAVLDNLFHGDVEGYSAEDVSAATLQFQSGAVASIAGTNGAIPGKWQASFQLVCKNLTAEFADANHATLYRTDQEPIATTQIDGTRNLMREETLDLLHAIETGGATRTPMSEGAKTLELVLAVAKSGQSGEVVRW